MYEGLTAGIDIGTSTVCAVIGRSSGAGTEVLGRGMAASKGISKGVIVNLEAAQESVRRAVREAESAAGRQVRAGRISISGSHVQSVLATGVGVVRGGIVTESDIARAVDSARAVYMPLNREMLHLLPVDFAVDRRGGIYDPVGMTGERLRAETLVVTADIFELMKLRSCCEKAGLQQTEVVFSPIAAGASALTAEERELGVILVDIGGGVTEVALFKGGRLRGAAVIGVGGGHFTNDIAVGLDVQWAEAERIKRTWGAAWIPDEERTAPINVTRQDGSMSVHTRGGLAEIIQPRCEEISEMISGCIRGLSGGRADAAGVVLAGGGACMSGMADVVSEAAGLPVRTSFRQAGGADRGPDGRLFSVAIGLVAGHHQARSSAVDDAEGRTGVIGNVKDWVKDILLYRYSRRAKRKIHIKTEGGAECLRSRK